MKQISCLIFACLCVLALSQSYCDDLVDGEVYFVTVAGSGKVLDIGGGPGSGLIQNTKNEGPSQQFKFEYLPGTNDYVKITAVHSGLVLAVDGSSLEDGAHIIQLPFADEENQKWRVETYVSCWAGPDGFDCGTEGFKFYSVKSGMALSVNGEDNDDGANIIQTERGGYTSFKLYSV